MPICRPVGGLACKCARPNNNNGTKRGGVVTVVDEGVGDLWFMSMTIMHAMVE